MAWFGLWMPALTADEEQSEVEVVVEVVRLRGLAFRRH